MMFIKNAKANYNICVNYIGIKENLENKHNQNKQINKEITKE